MEFIKVRKGSVVLTVPKTDRRKYLNSGFSIYQEGVRRTTKSNIEERQKNRILIKGVHYD